MFAFELEDLFIAIVLYDYTKLTDNFNHHHYLVIIILKDMYITRALAYSPMIIVKYFAVLTPAQPVAMTRL